MACWCSCSALHSKGCPTEGKSRLVACFDVFLGVQVGAWLATDPVLLGEVLELRSSIAVHYTFLLDEVFNFDRLLFGNLVEADELLGSSRRSWSNIINFETGLHLGESWRELVLVLARTLKLLLELLIARVFAVVSCLRLRLRHEAALAVIASHLNI